MAYNPRQDPYYADLFDATPTSFAEDYQVSLGRYRQQEGQQLQNEAAQLRLEEAQQEAERQARIKESLEGVSYDDPDIYEKAQQAYGKEGQIEKVLELQKIKDSMAAQQEARENRELNIINGVKDPYLQAEMWNKSKFAEKFGNRDPKSFQDQKLQIGDDGRVIDLNSLKAGDVVSGFKAPREEKQKAPSPKEVFDPTTGKMVYVNTNDPKTIAAMLSGGYAPPPRANTSQSLESLGSSQKNPRKVSNMDAEDLRKIQEAKKKFGNNVNIQSLIKQPTIK